MSTAAELGRLPSPIAIDGPAASGKSTVGAALAARFGYRFLDTGLMYRAITLHGLRTGVEPDEPLPRIAKLIASTAMRIESGAETRIFLGDEDVTELLRRPEVEAKVSGYSAIPAIREAMVSLQREVASEGPSVLAGRDIGTVVLPDAPIKVFLDASEEARARRRGAQSAQDESAARHDIASRDIVDRTRTTSPTRAADDAVVIDTTEISLAETVQRVLKLVECART